MHFRAVVGSLLAFGALFAVQSAKATIITQVANGGGYDGSTINVMFDQAHILHGEYLSSVTMSITAEGGGGAEITPYDGFPVDVEFAMSIGVTVNGPGIPYKQPFETDSFDLIANLYFSGDVYDSTVG